MKERAGNCQKLPIWFNLSAFKVQLFIYDEAYSSEIQFGRTSSLLRGANAKTQSDPVTRINNRQNFFDLQVST